MQILPFLPTVKIWNKCNVLYFRYVVRPLGATFLTLYDRPSGWYHLALNYFGSSQGQGITVYHNGEKIPTTGGRDRMPFVEANTAGEGSVAIGRFPITGNWIVWLSGSG